MLPELSFDSIEVALTCEEKTLDHVIYIPLKRGSGWHGPRRKSSDDKCQSENQGDQTAGELPPLPYQKKKQDGTHEPECKHVRTINMSK